MVTGKEDRLLEPSLAQDMVGWSFVWRSRLRDGERQDAASDFAV